MQKRIPHPCPVCNSTNEKVFLQPTVDESDPAKLYGAASGIPGTQRLVQCQNCEMIYESPRYDAATIVQGYMSSQEAGHDSQYPMRVKSFFLTLKKLANRIPGKGAKVLDIGTAGGAFLDAAAQYGFDAFGMEPSADLVARGQARGLKIQQGTIESHKFAPSSFDMVCLWDVIEHLPDPKFALEEVKKLLKPDGILLINYPDIGTWQAKLAGKKFWWILSVHLHHFTRRTIFDICKRTGFDAFHFQRYWQVLEFGYLERMAVHYKIPLTKFITNWTPQFIQRIPLPYYASQTTALARISK
ncbi:MAG: class I SAM-dependent methyltransferase [Bdellovibrionaceae bacterium]|nr:class I SAM-dependent methyltransferase [Pseudobdellovibrionaceae bacterium]